MIIEKNTITVSCELDFTRNAKLDQLKADSGINKSDIVLQAVVEYIDKCKVDYKSNWNIFASQFSSIDKFSQPLVNSLTFVSFDIESNKLIVSLPLKYKDLVDYAQSLFTRKCVNEAVNNVFGSRPTVLVKCIAEENAQQTLV